MKTYRSNQLMAKGSALFSPFCFWQTECNHNMSKSTNNILRRVVFFLRDSLFLFSRRIIFREWIMIHLKSANRFIKYQIYPKRLLFFLIFTLIISGACNQHVVVVDSKSVVNYILSCQKQNGGFGPINLEYADLAWTYPAIHALVLLGEDISNPDSCYVNGGKSWIEKAPWRNGPWYWSLHQKANLYKLMNRTGPLEDDFHFGSTRKLNFEPRMNYTEFRNYIDGDFFDMASLWNITEAIHLTNGSVDNKDAIKDYVFSRKTKTGGFEEMLGERNSPLSKHAHIITTHDAVMILHTLDIKIPDPENLANWIQSCQTPGGGFRWHPEQDSYSNQPDAWYTWAAIKALKVLGKSPSDPDACIRWINSLQNADGGFGDRPGWQSRLYSTYYAVHSLEMLTGDIKNAISRKKISGKDKSFIPDGRYSIYQAHHKSPAGGNEMVDAVDSMGFNLIAVKTLEAEVYDGQGMSERVKAARKYAEEKGYELEIVDAPENYKHRLVWFTGMNGNHVSNFMIPPDVSPAAWEAIQTAYKEGIMGYDWNEYKERVIQPVSKYGTLFYPELDYTMLNAYRVYDEGLDGNTGYNAVPAAHFGNYDWLRHFPYKERWLGQLPMIADGDAHADISKWGHNLDAFRNIYIAKSHRYNDYLDASLNGRSVCVIRMPESGEVRYYGSPEAIDYLKKHFSDWKWWQD